MRRVNVVVCLLLAGLAGAITSGCGSSSAVSGPETPAVTGSSVLQGALTAPGISASSALPGVEAQSGGSGASGWVLSIAGTSLSCSVDEDGRFVLDRVPAGQVMLRIDGPGVSAQVSVSGLVDGLVTSVEIRVTSGGAELASPPKVAPSAETFFSGSLDQAAGTQLVVAGRRVDASQIRKVWRGERRIELSQLEVGELVKVWGELRGDALVVAEEIRALTSGSETWVSFSGRVEHVSQGFLPNPQPVCHPTLVVKGTAVQVKPETRVWHTNGSELSACAIKVGYVAAVEGWKKNGAVRATRIVAGP